MKDFDFHNPTKIVFGKGRVAEVGAQTAALGKHALLVTGGGSAKKTGLHGRVMASLGKAGVDVTELSGVNPNPEIGSVREGAALCREKGIDAILAVGGGSVVDASKTIAAGAVHGGDPWDFFTKKIKPDDPLPIGVVLTLAATGSEANGNAVITNPDMAEKRAMYHPRLYPRFSILDPELTFTVPANQTAYGAVDVMAHVFEQYFHDVPATPIQDGVAETLMRTIIGNAPIAIAEPDHYDARANILWASTMALNGVIAAGAVGDWTCHFLEHELSAKYGIAHGAGLAVVFPSWMRRMAPMKTARFKQFAVNVWGVDPAGKSGLDIANEGVERTRAFFTDSLGVGVTMADYGIGGEKIELMADSVVDQKGEKNLGGLTRDDLVGIFRDALV